MVSLPLHTCLTADCMPGTLTGPRTPPPVRPSPLFPANGARHGHWLQLLGLGWDRCFPAMGPNRSPAPPPVVPQVGAVRLRLCVPGVGPPVVPRADNAGGGGCAQEDHPCLPCSRAVGSLQVPQPLHATPLSLHPTTPLSAPHSALTLIALHPRASHRRACTCCTCGVGPLASNAFALCPSPPRSHPSRCH